MARWPELTKQQAAFLDMLAWSEGTSTSKWTQDDGYDIIVDGLNSPHRFGSYKTHPMVKVTVNSKGLKSTAAGRYQCMGRNWIAYSSLLHLDAFDPISQDKITIQQIKEFKALPLIESGRVIDAIAIVRNLWASLPGGTSGQPHQKMADLLAQFKAHGGLQCGQF